MIDAKPSVQDALNYRFYLERLDDPGLLDRAIVTEDGDLAIPAGGKRLGGYIQVSVKAAGTRLVRQMASRPDEFPDARLFRGDGWIVEWGPELDWRGDGEDIPEDYVSAGRYFGYTEAAIAAYGQRRPAADRHRESPPAIVQAKARVVNEMDHLDENCRVGLDVGYAVKCLEEAIENLFETLLGN